MAATGGAIYKGSNERKLRVGALISFPLEIFFSAVICEKAI